MAITDDLASRTLYVGNLAAGIDEKSLHSIFDNCGHIASIRIAGKPGFNTCFAFVEFVDQSHAGLGIAMDGLDLGKRRMKVSMADRKALAKHQHKIAKFSNRESKIPLQAQVQARIMAAKASMSPQSYVSQPAASDYTSYGGLPPQSASDPFRPHEVLQPTYESRFYQGQSPGTQPLQLPLHTQLPVMGAPLMPQPGHSSPFLTRSPQLPGHHDPHLPPQVQECYHPRAPSPYQPQFQDRYQPQAQDVYQPRIEDPYPYPSPECPQFETDPWDYERQGSRHAVNGQRAVRPRQDPNRVERTVFVENVPHDMNEQALADHFGACGEVTKVRCANDGAASKAWLEFRTPIEAKAAREYDQTVLGPHLVRVKQSKTAIHTNGLSNRSFRQRSRSPKRSRNRDKSNNNSRDRQSRRGKGRERDLGFMPSA